MDLLSAALMIAHEFRSDLGTTMDKLRKPRTMDRIKEVSHNLFLELALEAAMDLSITCQWIFLTGNALSAVFCRFCRTDKIDIS